MIPIRYVQGDATCPLGAGPRIIVHVCNDVGAWGAGFVVALSRRWSAPERAYRDAAKRDPLRLGDVGYVVVGDDLFVANMVAQRGVGLDDGLIPLRYEALARCLEDVSRWAVRHNASVHMPRIGCGLAGGKWEFVEALVREALSARDIEVTVYDWSGPPSAARGERGH